MHSNRRQFIAALAVTLASPVPLAFAQSTPQAIVQGLVDAMQANDAARIRAMFSPDASQAYGDAPAKRGDAFFKWLQSDIIDLKGRVEGASLAVNGNDVVVSGQYRNSSGYSSRANFLIKVEGGRIVSWQMRY